MRKYLPSITTLALPLLCMHGAARAQTNVTIYGILDVGVQYLSNANAKGQQKVSVASGSFLPSRIGFKGKEELGRGYSAFFLVENGFNADDGTQTSASTIFNRFSYVGIASPYGTLSAGRQGSVQFNKTYLYDPLSYATYSNLSLNAAPSANFKINNSLRYQSPDFLKGFNIELDYGFGQELAGSSAGRYAGAALEYINGPLSARILNETTHGAIAGEIDQSASIDRRSSIAAVYKLDKLTLFGDFTRVTGDLHASPAGNIYTAAVSYSPSSVWRYTVEAGLYDQGSATGKPKLLDVMVQRFLSRQISLYAISGYMINSGGTAYGVAFPTVTETPGQTQLGVTLGMNYRF